MSPEQFHDAMNYLDDDLITETDELRQGWRVLQPRFTVRSLLPWVAMAACLVLVLGLGSRFLPATESNGVDTMLMEDMQEAANQSPAEAVQDKSQYGIGTEHSTTNSWQRIAAGDLSLAIPGDWEYTLEPGEDNSLMIALHPAGAVGALKIGYMPYFGVCGTGLTEKQTTIAGMEANVGYYDGGKDWTFITFRVDGETYVVLKDSVGGWWSDHADTVDQILETIVIGS